MSQFTYDVFISHAYEDQREVVAPLSAELEKAGCRVWYSGKGLTAGAELKKTILEEVIPKSDFCVVLLSPDALQSTWVRDEVARFRRKRGKHYLLPVLYGVTAEDAGKPFRDLMTKFAVTHQGDTKDVALKLVKKIKHRHIRNGFTFIFRFLVLSVLGIGVHFAFDWYDQEATKVQLTEEVHRYIVNWENRLVDAHVEEIRTGKGSQFLPQRMSHLYNRLTRGQKVELTQLSFAGSFGTEKGRRNLEKMGLPVSGATPELFYNQHLDEPFVLHCIEDLPNGIYELDYALFNVTQPAFSLGSLKPLSRSEVQVNVTYSEPVRYVRVHLVCNAGTRYKPKAKVMYKGFRKHEHYVFRQKDGYWEFAGLLKSK